MKTIGVVLVLLLVVAGVAVGGSRAQTIPATSVAFDQCQQDGAAGLTQCTPLVARMAMNADESDVDARGLGDVGANEAGADISPEDRFQDRALAVGQAVLEAFLGALAREMVNHYFGNGLPIMPDSPVASTVFDPVK